MSRSVRSDSVRPGMLPPEVHAPVASRPSSPLPLVSAASPSAEAGPSRSILSEQLSRGEEVRAIATGAAKAVPRPPARASTQPPLHASASEPLLPMQRPRVPSSAAGDGSDGLQARPGLDVLARVEDALHGSAQPSVDASSSGLPVVESPDMSGEFNVR